MASDNPIQSNNFVSYVENHPLIVAGIVVIVGLFVGHSLNKNKSSTTTPLNGGIDPLTGQPYPNASNAYVTGSNLGALFNGSGTYNGGINPVTGLPYTNNNGIINPLTGQPIVYVPTGTSFTTNNVGAQFTGQTGSVTVNATNSISPTTKVVAPVSPIAPSKPIVNNPAPLPSTPSIIASPTPVSQPPVTPPPQKSVKWTGSYIVKGGDTLAGIASQVSNNLRAQGAPVNTVVTYQQIYSNNKSIIDSTSNAHGNPIPGGPWNNIFPGERLIIPVWA
jgi:hypothetical protein